MERLYYLEIMRVNDEPGSGYREVSDLTLGEALDLIEEYADGTYEFSLSPQ